MKDEILIRIFSLNDADTNIDLGGSGGLSCYGVGVPPPTTFWTREDGRKLPPHINQDDMGNLRVTG